VIPVVGTTLTLTGPSSLVIGSSRHYNVTLDDAGKNPITATSVTVASPGNYRHPNDDYYDTLLVREPFR